MKISFSLLCFFSLLAPLATFAQGNLLLFPMRIEFDGTKQRIMDLNIANTGKDSAVYSISFSHLKMKSDGSFEEVQKTDSSQQFADPYIRFFPHTVKLGPKESQIVKVMLTHISDIKPGEYRTHLYFRAIPGKEKLGDTSARKKDSKTISIQIKAVFGIAIPIIIHSGEQHVNVNLSALSLSSQDTSNFLNLTFNRSGNVSSYGHVKVTYINGSGKHSTLAYIQGLAVYSPNTIRTAKIHLNQPASFDPHSGTIHVEYRKPEEKKNELLAESNLSLK